MIPRFKDGRDVFFERRWGMFIHWGLYAIPAWHEQILWRGNGMMKRSEYEKLIDEFNPVNFDPDKWIDIAQAAGMEYICFTTKHHDGFCMWDTKYTSYNVMNSKYGKDILAMLAEACARRNFPLSLYYSCPDWHHPKYPNLGRHHEMFGPRPGDIPDLEGYYAYVRQQIEELYTNYGTIYQFFWDVNVAEHHDPSLNEYLRELQPGILINNRGPAPGDYSTPERSVPDGNEFDKPTEAVQSLGRESWGYKSDEDYYSHKYIMQSIDKILAMGGNYLLNVGPQADGSFPEESLRGLERIGNWYHSIKEAFDGTTAISSLVQKDEIVTSSGQRIERDHVLATKRDHTLYIHLYRDLQTNAVVLKPWDVVPLKATLLNNGQSLDASVDFTPWYWKDKPYLRIRNIPVNEFVGEVMVLKLEFDRTLSE
ncbi:MAG: alpha-L-fucosidase [Gorillibacterium sp.]|nr:alpha-L-fucosidase [Gorillibacterium sp.]